MYLTITSPGEAPIEAFTLLGASTKLTDKGDDTIGMFGSGNKFAVATLLRAGLDVRVITGAKHHTFGTLPGTFRDTPHYRVTLDGTELSWTTDYGAKNWTIAMALREFVSNAIDECTVPGELPIVRFEDNLPETAPGFTMMAVELNAEVTKFMDELHLHFLHWAEPNHMDAPIKIVPVGPCRLYRRGVLIGTDKAPSIFRYNVDFSLSEARTIEHTNVHEGAADAWKDCDNPELLKALFGWMNDESMERLDGPNPWELRCNFYWIAPDVRAAWVEAFVSHFGADAVVGGDRADNDRAEKMGHKIVSVVGLNYVLTNHTSIPTALEVGTPYLAMKHHQVPVSADLMEEFTHCWAMLVALDLTRGKDVPKLFSFEADTVGASVIWGVSQKDNVGISAGCTGNFRRSTILEELAHYITGASDKTLDLQTFAFQMAAHFMGVA